MKKMVQNERNFDKNDTSTRLCRWHAWAALCVAETDKLIIILSKQIGHTLRQNTSLNVSQ